MKIVISGAGLVGPLLSLFMKRRGHEVDVFEKRSDPRKLSQGEGRSINLVLTSRGLVALKQLGIHQEVLSYCSPVKGRMMHSKEGELTYQAYGKDSSECNFSVSRSELNNDLMTRAEKEGVTFHFEKEVTSWDEKENVLIFQDGEKTEAADKVFVTDGIASSLRKKLMQVAQGEDRLESQGVFYKEFLMPSQAGSYVIEKEALHIWPRGEHFLMALPNKDGSFTMTLYLPEERVATTEMQTYFQENYADMLSLVPNLFEQLERNPWGKLGTLWSSPWFYQEKLLVLGDASHGIVPFFGQGMNSGFEDCFLLDKNWGESFESFYQKRKPCTDAIATMALENYTEMAEKVADPIFLERKKLMSQLENDYPDLFRSRYALVTYSLIPYDLIFEYGKIQEEVVDLIQAGSEASEVLQQKMAPFLERHSLSFDFNYKALFKGT